MTRPQLIWSSMDSAMKVLMTDVGRASSAAGGGNAAARRSLRPRSQRVHCAALMGGKVSTVTSAYANVTQDSR